MQSCGCEHGAVFAFANDQQSDDRDGERISAVAGEEIVRVQHHAAAAFSGSVARLISSSGAAPPPIVVISSVARHLRAMQ